VNQIPAKRGTTQASFHQNRKNRSCFLKKNDVTN